MLKADINQIEPECIIDTEKFIQSLHKEFEQAQSSDPTEQQSNSTAAATDGQAAAQQ